MITSGQPSIAVIIPVYNRADTIVNCINSVLHQSFPGKEIIVIDDKSTDDTIKTLEIFEDKITILQNENRHGAQYARNVGIKAAKSDWIAFLDSDDEWLPQKLAKQITILETVNFNPNSVVHGDCYLKNINSQEKQLWSLDLIEGENAYNQLLTSSGTFFPAILTSKKALEKINYLDENVKSYQEWETAIRLAKFCTFFHIREPLFFYNTHDDTISKNSDNSINGYQYIINKHKKEIIAIAGNDAFDNHLFLNAKMAMNNNRFDMGQKLLEQITANSIKKRILLLVCYSKIKPNYFTKLKRILLWKK